MGVIQVIDTNNVSHILEAVEGWTDFWQNNGKLYTGLEPYVILQKTLSRIAGTPISMRGIVGRTSDSKLASTFH